MDTHKLPIQARFPVIPRPGATMAGPGFGLVAVLGRLAALDWLATVLLALRRA